MTVCLVTLSQNSNGRTEKNNGKSFSSRPEGQNPQRGPPETGVRMLLSTARRYIDRTTIIRNCRKA